VGTLTSQPYGPSRPVTGIALPLPFTSFLLLGNLFSVHGLFILFQNVQQIAIQMKNYSEMLQDLAKDMDNVSKSMAAVQEHSLGTKNDK
jgi:hypothetical protein